MAIITNKAYLEVGFILEACSFSFRDEEIGADTSSMLSHVQKEQGLDSTVNYYVFRDINMKDYVQPIGIVSISENT